MSNSALTEETQAKLFKFFNDGDFVELVAKFVKDGKAQGLLGTEEEYRSFAQGTAAGLAIALEVIAITDGGVSPATSEALITTVHESLKIPSTLEFK
jgi:hypothetical protein